MTDDAATSQSSNSAWEHTIEADYEGAKLTLNYSHECRASLCINGIERDSAFSMNDNATLKLGSPVQTGYEHHEFIEASIHYEQASITATLATGGEPLKQITMAR